MAKQQIHRGGAEQKIRQYLIDNNYVEQKDEREAVDIQAFNARIARIVERRAELRTAIDAIVADLKGEQA